MIKNRKIYNNLVEKITEYFGTKWLNENNITMTHTTKFNKDLNFDILNEVAITSYVEETFNIVLPHNQNKWFETMNDMVDYISDIIITRHFEDVWQPNIIHFQHSGDNLIETINDDAPNKVLDVGCGTNYFKGKIHNLLGIDPIRTEADITTTILDYETTETYDVILILGSINFGSEEYILQQLKKVISLLSDDGKIYARVNPGIEDSESPWMDFFEWNEALIAKYANDFDLTISTDIQKDYNGRLMFVYSKKKIQ